MKRNQWLFGLRDRMQSNMLQTSKGCKQKRDPRKEEKAWGADTYADSSLREIAASFNSEEGNGGWRRLLD